MDIQTVVLRKPHQLVTWVPAKQGRSRLQLLWQQVEVVQDPVGVPCVRSGAGLGPKAGCGQSRPIFKGFHQSPSRFYVFGVVPSGLAVFLGIPKIRVWSLPGSTKTIPPSPQHRGVLVSDRREGRGVY